jgi:RNA polymerase sigma factor (TIGR02999 family)
MPLSSPPKPTEVTELLAQWRGGDKVAEQRLISVLYPMLRTIAHRIIRPASHRLSLRATELAHEAYLRLADQRSDWVSRAHFLGIAARVTRRVLIDLVREREAGKRGAGVEVLSLELEAGTDIAAGGDRIDWLALEQALRQLEARDPIAAKIVELRYFGGLSNDEVGDLLGIGVATVGRHWKFARAWLHKRL